MKVLCFARSPKNVTTATLRSGMLRCPKTKSQKLILSQKFTLTMYMLLVDLEKTKRQQAKMDMYMP